MTGGWRAWLRLLAVQGTWNYERMLGVGMGYAAEPLLEDLKTVGWFRNLWVCVYGRASNDRTP